RQRSRLTARTHARAMKDLTRVDVADPGDPLLVEQEALDRHARAARACAEPFPAERRGNRIGSELAQCRIARQARGGSQTKQSEAARVLEPQLRAVLESDSHMDVGHRARRLVEEQPAAAHPEVRDQGEVLVEMNQQELAVALHGFDPSTAETAGEMLGDRIPQLLSR